MRAQTGSARPKIAIAHDYLTQRGGAERVVLTMLKAFPDATLYTTLYNPETTYPEFADARIVTSPLDRLDAFRRHHRTTLPLLPWAASRIRIDADLTLVSSSGWAHGFNITGRRLVYCYSPARWLYQTPDYVHRKYSLENAAVAVLRPGLVRWDRSSARKADRYLAISRVVRDRIAATYGIDSTVLAAPHSMDPQGPVEPVAELSDWGPGYHLLVSRLLPYKNVEKAVAAYAGLPAHRLVIVGHGPLIGPIAASLPPNIRLLSHLSDSQLRGIYAGCGLLLAPSVEDFGLTPLEAGSFGKPVAALRYGGYLDTVVEGVTGLFFDDAGPAAIRRTVLDACDEAWDPEKIKENAGLFTESRFIDALHTAVREPFP